jgi:hypothetical protein
MTIIVVLVGMLAGLAWFLPETEATEKAEQQTQRQDIP